MTEEILDFIKIGGCREHNLKAISLQIPLKHLTLVCGVSGSGKSTLAHDVLFCEGQGRFLESFSAYARIFQARMSRSHTDFIENIPPALAIGQRFSNINPRSTVATLTDLYSPIRLLFSRFGQHGFDQKPSRSHLSFNHALGTCPNCQGLGQTHTLNLGSLIADEHRSLRHGALALSTPNGYIIYSQVTIDVLNQVCQAHGFNVDIPWKDLTAEQKQVVLYGSDRLTIPFGKHPLESRLKWTGITAKPRELGLYRGIVPIMQDILQRDPNPNILRFCQQTQCPTCGGLRLTTLALDVSYRGTSLRALLSFNITQLADWAAKVCLRPDLSRPEKLLLSDLTAHSQVLCRLSLGHLVLHRSVPSLSLSEGQRIQIGSLLKNPISGMLYVLDEPGSGLHPHEKKDLYQQLRKLVDIGSTVIMVSHDRQALQFADWVVELGPAGGAKGGHLLFSDLAKHFCGHNEIPHFANSRRNFVGPANLLFAGYSFASQAINVVSGLSGSGKSALLAALAEQDPKCLDEKHTIQRIISIDQQPLGKNARSNPATYTKLFDDIRSLFAKQPQAQELNLTASSFSFNTDQGSCPNCQGAGVIEITMHYLYSLFQVCPQCQGRRYQDSVLAVRYQGLSIDEVLNLTIDQAHEFFASQVKIAKRLNILAQLGLGYLNLGQPSSTLSGGEAQRVRLASYIHLGQASETLYLFDEPCQGLHDQDIPFLLRALEALRDQGATLVVAENTPTFIAQCDWLLELAPWQNENRLIYDGPLAGIFTRPGSLVAAMLKEALEPQIAPKIADRGDITRAEGQKFIHLTGVRTHNLQNVSVAIPEQAFTLVGGPSGSGKSSLLFETLYKACQRLYAQQLSPYLRDRLALTGDSAYDEIAPYKPAVALAAQYLEATPRSTVGTLSGINDSLRLLFSRLGQGNKADLGPVLHASHFSFNHHDGACPTCNGLGHGYEADASRWVLNPQKSIGQGAFSLDKTCQHFLEPHGRYLAILQAAAQKRQIDIKVPWQELKAEALALILQGSPGEFEVVWSYKRGKRSGEHRFKSAWLGLNQLVLQEFLQKKELAKRQERYQAVVFKNVCLDCRGLRLREAVLNVRIGAVNLSDMLSSPLANLKKRLENSGEACFRECPTQKEQLVCQELMPILTRQLESLIELGLGYLTLGRAVNTLSSGEHQRLRVASLLGNRLNHSLFIFDEMSRGLHPFDVAHLIGIVRRLLVGGNTIVAIDHHPFVLAQADWLIELGPGSGKNGGQVTYMGPQKPSTDMDFRMAVAHEVKDGPRCLNIHSATVHNLNRLDLSIPTEGLTVLCGVSGSGKSTLLHRVILPSAQARGAVNCASIKGLEQFEQVFSFTPQGPNRYTAETIADFLDLSPTLYKKFLRSAGKAAACRHCDGQGEFATDLDYMGSFVESCTFCQGSGLAAEICQQSLHGHTLIEILSQDMADLPVKITEVLGAAKIRAILAEFALDYLALGRRMRTLSTGEVQRLRLARLFAQLGSEPCLLLLDEPDSGLSYPECQQLLNTLKKHLSQEHAAIAISHHPLMMSQADYVIDLGPGAGQEGGQVTAYGSPQQILAGDWPLSKTAAYLRQVLTA